MNHRNIISGHIVDVLNHRIFDGEIHIKDGKIEKTVARPVLQATAPYILPGFIDSHVHIESSMLTPSHFADAAVQHGTIGCVCDPHEIANVCGMEGINFMINDSKKKNFRFAFTAPSCVPATPFETSGFTLNSTDIRNLLARKEVFALAEMMNFPGVLNNDKEVFEKIQAAKGFGKPTDGHAPMLTGKDLEKYVSAGISTDHECSTLQEAEEKIRLGMKILIREGSAAKNFETLCPLIDKYPDNVMFCTDDCHPDELLKGHINQLVKRSLQKGLPLWHILKAACVNPVLHYRLPVGLLQKGDTADFITVNNLEDMDVLSVFIGGELVFNKLECEKKFVNSEDNSSDLPNNFRVSEINEKDIVISSLSSKIKVIQAEDKQLITRELTANAKIIGGNIVSDTANDVLKLVVCNRYKPSKPAVGFINGFNLKDGALASTIAHDSHNIIALGTTDSLIVKAINQLIANKGGICAVSDTECKLLELPCGGLMSNQPIHKVAKEYKSLNDFSKKLGCKFNAPFMTMAFTALLVIPELKLSDKGLFDVRTFSFTSLFA